MRPFSRSFASWLSIAGSVAAASAVVSPARAQYPGPAPQGSWYTYTGSIVKRFNPTTGPWTWNVNIVPEGNAEYGPLVGWNLWNSVTGGGGVVFPQPDIVKYGQNTPGLATGLSAGNLNCPRGTYYFASHPWALKDGTPENSVEASTIFDLSDPTVAALVDAGKVTVTVSNYNGGWQSSAAAGDLVFSAMQSPGPATFTYCLTPGVPAMRGYQTGLISYAGAQTKTFNSSYGLPPGTRFIAITLELFTDTQASAYIDDVSVVVTHS